MADRASNIRYWIFQAMPDRYDLEEHLVPGKEESWALTRYRHEISKDDIVYFWRGGRQPGLYGWGVVTSQPYEDKAAKSKRAEWSIDVRYEVRFKHLITDLRQSPYQPHLAGLLLLRAPQGTNFKLTTNEVIFLNKWLLDLRESIPPDPEGTGTRFFPLSSLTPINMGPTTTLILRAGLTATGDVLDSRTLLDVMLTAAVSARDDSSGTLYFLAQKFNQFDFPSEVEQALANSVPLSKAVASGKYRIASDVLVTMETARLLAIYSTRQEKVSVRHLFAAIIMSAMDRTLEYLARMLNTIGLTLHQFLNEFIEFTAASFQSDDTSLWLTQFHNGASERIASLGVVESVAPGGVSKIAPSPQADIAQEAVSEMAPTTETAPTIGTEVDAAARALARAFHGRPVPDLPFGTDLLRIDSEVAALAHLFALQDEPAVEQGTAPASKEVKEVKETTFALGLFGRWGAGKSFFIEKLKSKITKLSKLDTPKSIYCKNIVHIDFNAWHYNEANIWASLVHHIFDTLQKRFKEEQKEEEFKSIIRQLEVSQERRAQLESLIDSKENESRKYQENITNKENEIESNIDKQLQSISQLPHRLAMNYEARQKLLALLPQAADLLGVPTKKFEDDLKAGGQNATQILHVLQEGGALMQRGQAMGRTILRSGLSKTFIIVVFVVVGIYVAVPLLTEEGIWEKLLSQSGQVVVAATSILAWFKTRMTKAYNLYNEFSGVEAMLREDVKKEEQQKDDALTTMRAEQERISAEIATAMENKDALDQEILELKNRLNELGSAESLVSYINDRASSADYRSKLGILALIRRDFEKLSKLMTAKTPASTGQEQIPKIDRIILYIDDLDRVQNSRKVLQVLEAVHLLLAFPLFHVVVAVDERWAARSVLSHHSDFFGIKSLSDHEEDSSVKQEKEKLLQQIGVQEATPREFLEKIFQISFWVRPLTEQLTEHLIKGIVNPSASEAAEEIDENNVGEHDSDVAQNANANTAITAVANNNTGDNTNNKEGGNENSQNNTDQPENAETNTPTMNQNQGNTQAQPQNQTQSKTQNNPTTLISQNTSEDEESELPDVNFDVTKEEQISMQALGKVIWRSPRTVKRFINTYRLFKAMNIPPDENASIMEDESDKDIIFKHHVPIMILLAIQVGHPDISVRLFEKIDEELSKNDSQNLGEMLATFKQDQPVSEVEKQRWLKAIKSLESVFTLYGETPTLTALSISALNPWLQATSRFGFQEWSPKFLL